MALDLNLREYATDIEWSYMLAIDEHGTRTQAAASIGKSHSTVCRAIKNLMARAAKAGYSPQQGVNHPVPYGYAVKGTSTLYDVDGNTKIQWVKTSQDAEQQEALMRAMIDGMNEDIRALPPLPSPESTQESLCNEYIITDFHYGSLCWHKEGGADWDVKIAGETLWRCFKMMVDSSPNSKYCVIAQLGDFFHSDSMKAMTPTSGHLLDQDGRSMKIIDEATQVFVRVVDYALQKHEDVHLVIAQGNHDEYSAGWKAVMFKLLYRNEPRLTVNGSMLPYYVYQHGETMLTYHHGHKKGMESLPLFFAAQYPKMWGNTIYRYCATGHKHSSEKVGKEKSGMIVEQFQTLTARDAYASHGGWLSERSATSNTYHKKYGKAGSIIIRPEMLEE